MTDLKDMTPGQILKAVRQQDMSIVKALTKYMVNEKKMTVEEIREALEAQGVKKDQSTIWRWTQH